MIYRCEKGIWDDYYVVIDDTYISKDDILYIGDIEYTIIAIDENYDTYLMNIETQDICKYDICKFIEFIINNYKKITYSRNMHLENIQRNIQQNTFWNSS